MFFWAKPADSTQWEEIPANGSGLLVAGTYNIAVQSPQPHFTIVSTLKQYCRQEDGSEELFWQTEQPSRTNDEGVGWIVQNLELSSGRWQINCRDADLVAELFGEDPSNSITFQVIDLKGARLSSGEQESFAVSLPAMTSPAAIAAQQQVKSRTIIAPQALKSGPHSDMQSQPEAQGNGLHVNTNGNGTAATSQANGNGANHSISPSNPTLHSDRAIHNDRSMQNSRISNTDHPAWSHSSSNGSIPNGNPPNGMTHQPPDPSGDSPTASTPSGNPDDDYVTEIFTPPTPESSNGSEAAEPSSATNDALVLNQSEFTAFPGESIKITGYTQQSGQLSITALAQNSILIQEVQRLKIPAENASVGFSVSLKVPDSWSEDAIVGVAELHPDDGSSSLSQDFTVTAEPHNSALRGPAPTQDFGARADEFEESEPHAPQVDSGLQEHESYSVVANIPEPESEALVEPLAGKPIEQDTPPWSPELTEADILPPNIAFASQRDPDLTFQRLLELVQSSVAATEARYRFQQARSTEPAKAEDMIDGIVGDVSVIDNSLPTPPTSTHSIYDSTDAGQCSQWQPVDIQSSTSAATIKDVASPFDAAPAWDADREQGSSTSASETVEPTDNFDESEPASDRPDTELPSYDSGPSVETVGDLQRKAALSPDSFTSDPIAAATAESLNVPDVGLSSHLPDTDRSEAPNTGQNTVARSDEHPPEARTADNLSIHIPQSLRSGDLVSVVMKSKIQPHPACVKLWVINSANQSVVDGPRWILDFSGDGDIYTGITHLTVPSRVQSLKFQACAYPHVPSDIEEDSDTSVPLATVTVHRAVSPR